MAYQSVNPFNGEVLRTFDQHTDHEMEQMLVAADRTFRDVWSRKPVRERAQVIGKAASLMLEQEEKFARLATLEMGKRIAESRGEVELSASILKYYAENAETFLAPRPLREGCGAYGWKVFAPRDVNSRRAEELASDKRGCRRSPRRISRVRAR
jgi:succinate-semialdehyde dehydrogenase / glutarate-semialdehyde dehydrogenase